MSVSITYEGRLKSADLITPILEELRDLAKELGWRPKRIGPKEYELIYGPIVTARGIELIIDPEGGMFESLTMTFDQEGNLVNENMLKLYSDKKLLRLMNKTTNPFTGEPQYRIWIPKTAEEKKKYTWDVLVKSDLFGFNGIQTNYLGPEKHILLCKLLRYLKKKYFKQLQVDDSSGHWKTGNVKRLAKEIETMNFFYGHVNKFFKHVEANPLPKNATLKDLLNDLTTYLALVSTQAPHLPKAKATRKKGTTGKKGTQRSKKRGKEE